MKHKLLRRFDHQGEHCGINWDLISEIDPNLVRIEEEKSLFKKLLHEFPLYKLSSGDSFYLGHPFSIRLCLLTQKMIKYLIFDQKRLKEHIKKLNHNVERLKQKLKDARVDKENAEMKYEAKKNSTICPCCQKAFRDIHCLDLHFQQCHQAHLQDWRKIRGDKLISPSDQVITQLKEIIVEVKDKVDKQQKQIDELVRRPPEIVSHQPAKVVSYNIPVAQKYTKVSSLFIQPKFGPKIADDSKSAFNTEFLERCERDALREKYNDHSYPAHCVVHLPQQAGNDSESTPISQYREKYERMYDINFDENSKDKKKAREAKQKSKEELQVDKKERKQNSGEEENDQHKKERSNQDKTVDKKERKQSSGEEGNDQHEKERSNQDKTVDKKSDEYIKGNGSKKENDSDKSKDKEPEQNVFVISDSGDSYNEHSVSGKKQKQMLIEVSDGAGSTPSSGNNKATVIQVKKNNLVDVFGSGGRNEKRDSKNNIGQQSGVSYEYTKSGKHSDNIFVVEHSSGSKKTGEINMSNPFLISESDASSNCVKIITNNKQDNNNQIKHSNIVKTSSVQPSATNKNEYGTKIDSNNEGGLSKQISSNTKQGNNKLLVTDSEDSISINSKGRSDNSKTGQSQNNRNKELKLIEKPKQTNNKMLVTDSEDTNVSYSDGHNVTKAQKVVLGSTGVPNKSQDNKGGNIQMLVTDVEKTVPTDNYGRNKTALSDQKSTDNTTKQPQKKEDLVPQNNDDGYVYDYYETLSENLQKTPAQTTANNQNNVIKSSDADDKATKQDNESKPQQNATPASNQASVSPKTSNAPITENSYEYYYTDDEQPANSQVQQPPKQVAQPVAEPKPTEEAVKTAQTEQKGGNQNVEYYYYSYSDDGGKKQLEVKNLHDNILVRKSSAEAPKAKPAGSNNDPLLITDSFS